MPTHGLKPGDSLAGKDVGIRQATPAPCMPACSGCFPDTELPQVNLFPAP
jgi:hypothetical protein